MKIPQIIRSVAATAIGLLFAASAVADIVIKQANTGEIIVDAKSYSVRIGVDGGLQSVVTGGVEMLEPYQRFKAASFLADYIPPGNTGIVSPKMTRLKLDSPRIVKGNKVTATGATGSVAYVFRDTEFDVLPKCERGLRFPFMLFPSKNVLQSLDLITDRAVSMSQGDAV